MSRAAEIADELIGTLLNICGVVSEEELDDPVLMAQLYALCFVCARCQWWCDIHEYHKGELCKECFFEEPIDDD